MGVGGVAPAACRNRPKLTVGSPESFESVRKRDEPAQALESWTTRATSGLSLKLRSVDSTSGTKLWYKPTIERRLMVLIEVATSIGTDEYRNLVRPIADNLFRQPPDWLDINTLVELVVSLNGSAMAEFEALVKPLRDMVFGAVSEGCSSDALREATRLLDDPPLEEHLDAFRLGFTAYIEHYFYQELSECRSYDQFQGLNGDLASLKQVLDIETHSLVERVEEALHEFEENEERKADALEDEYKERWREERYENETIADLFGSLNEWGR